MDVRRLTLCAVAVALALTACSGSTGDHAAPAPSTPTMTSSPTPATPSPAATSYVALGDSFTAGPGLRPGVTGSLLCGRSTSNYPYLVAERLGAGLTDVSCAGATTAQVDGSQLASVDAATGLVTVGIGGNDAGLFNDLLGCAFRSGTSTCEATYGNRTAKALATIRTNVTRTLDSVHDRAPDARVVLVGYLRILPDGVGCDALPIADADLAWGAGVERELDDVLRTAAATTGSTYVSMHEASAGHDACAGADAWVNGTTVPDDQGIPLHPRLAGMRAVADAVAATG